MFGNQFIMVSCLKLWIIKPPQRSKLNWAKLKNTIQRSLFIPVIAFITNDLSASFYHYETNIFWVLIILCYVDFYFYNWFSLNTLSSRTLSITAAVGSFNYRYIKLWWLNRLESSSTSSSDDPFTVLAVGFVISSHRNPNVAYVLMNGWWLSVLFSL